MNSQPLFQFVSNTAPITPDPSALQRSISQPMTFGTGPALVPKTRRRKQKSAAFKVPNYPIRNLANQSQSLADSLFPQSPTLTPIIGLGLDEPFLENGNGSQLPLGSSLFSNLAHTESLSNSTNTHSFSQFPSTPVTPALSSSSWSEPSSSPETFLHTPQSAYSSYSRPLVNFGDSPPMPIPPSISRSTSVSKTQLALDELHKIGLSPFEFISTLLDPMHEQFSLNRNAFFRHDSKVIPQLLTRIFDHPVGNSIFMNWLPLEYAS
ncbi:hypothetical protein BDP27DRAFT_1427430 [Rhodocollybia butyracea]|uniref:Uncharacterized protein n=1 Tax=Rhodocollybia butyracea TaxID=206335 RepID=A0A9P5PGF8_9AGAR|nr:hypothetical protein BDP27DRAFT_1427430 [Rhodocollybia butyracea]